MRGRAVSFEFHDSQRQLQQQFDTERMAARLGSRVAATIGDRERAFIEGRDMFFLATVDADGHPNCSYKGGAPGFVRVVDERTLAFPNYDGNGMYLSMGNVRQTGDVGLLFIDFDGQSRTRVNGRASIDDADPLLADFPEAQFIVRVAVREVFGNCPRYIHKMALVERSQFVPEAGRRTPSPAWKSGLAQRTNIDVLPADDPARDPDTPIAER